MDVEVLYIKNRSEVDKVASSLRSHISATHFNIKKVLDICQAWSESIISSPAGNIPGAVFLSMWLKRTTLERILRREFGEYYLENEWLIDGNSWLKPFPVGIVGHWPAGNIEIQPVLSLVCSLLGGNGAIVRVPTELVEIVKILVEPLVDIDNEHYLTKRFSLISYDYKELLIQERFADIIDGAMIWGGEEAVVANRSLPFRPKTRICVFGPRVSVSLIDSKNWASKDNSKKWCTRIARDVWQFDQQACTSPQVLFVEKNEDVPISVFVNVLSEAFKEENRLHPRVQISPFITSSITKARAECLLSGQDNFASFPLEPDWSILVYNEPKFPIFPQGRTLNVVVINSLEDAIELLTPDVQTLGIAVSDKIIEKKLAELAGLKGVDRIVRIGMMHVFDSPWDGSNIVSSMVRTVRFLPTNN